MSSYNFVFSQSKPVDSLKKDTVIGVIDTISLKSSNSDIQSKIVYNAEDSIVYDIQTRKMYLYNKSVVDYTDIHIDAYYIDYDWTTGLLSANQNKINEDSILGRPYMKQDGKDYFTDRLQYNFKSKKGKVYDIVTKDNDALLHGHEVKKDSIGNWFISKAKYTTCDLEHPHFYFNAKKLKLTTKKSIITGPTNIVINDVQTPIYLPFGIYPTQSGRRSGIILPQQYGFSPYFNLQNMGFYFGINDHLDAKVLADVYFNGSYQYSASARYNRLYQYNGEFTVMTNRIYTGDPDNPTVKETTPANYYFTWTHTQSPKAHPTFNFNSSLTYMTQGAYNRSLVLDPRRTNSQITSNLNITKRFRYKPLIITGGVNYTQDLSTKTVSGYLPSLRVNYNGNIFKSKTNSNSMVLGFIYASEAIAQFSNLPDSQIFNGEIFKKLSYGIKHGLTFNFTNIRLWKYINVTPNLTYTDRNYFKKLVVSRESGETKPDTAYQEGFYSIRDFSGGIGLNTVITGIYPFSKKGFLRGIKHQVTPNIGFSYNPNFGRDFWGYNNYYNDTANRQIKYFQYQGPYGGVSEGASGMINFSISNAIEGKFRNKKDSINGTQKLMILDALSFGSSYNLIADSFKLANFGIGFSNTTLRYLTFSGNMTFSPYVWEQGRRLDRYKIFNGDGIFRFTNMNITATLILNATNFSKRILDSKKGSEFERDWIYKNYYFFYDFNSPWNLSMSFNMNLTRDFTYDKLQDTTKLNASVVLNNFDFNLTKNWKIGISSGFDFSLMKVGITTIKAIRNMHCWEFSVNYTPISNFGQAYAIEIRPKAALLQDLKITRTRPAIENFF